MAYSIDLTAALKTSRQDNRSKAVDFPTSASEKTYNFRDSLKDAVRVRDTDVKKPDSNAELRRELINRSESKLKSMKKPEQNRSDEGKTVEESDNEKIDKNKMTIEEMLSKLEELSKLQQLGEIPTVKQTELLEGIKEAIKELTAIQGRSTGIESTELQTKTTELAVKLEELLNELKANGGFLSKEAALDFTQELKSVMAETAKLEAALEAAPKAQVDNRTAEQLKVNENSISETAAIGFDSANAVKGQIKEAALNDESQSTTEVSEEQKQEVKAEAPITDTKPIIKDSKPAAEEATEEIKTALDGKVEKVAVEGRENKKQDADSESSKGAPQQAPKAVNTVQHKQGNQEMAAIMQDQATVENQVKPVQNLTTAPKAEPVNKAEVINQIVRKAEVMVTDAKQEMRMQLEPENLGKLTLKMAVEKGLITAKFVAESYEVKQVIESHFNELKDMLQEKGLEVQNFSVSVGQDNKEYNNGNAFQQWKETVKLNGRSLSKEGYDGYNTSDGISARAVNPYSIHDGKFDHRA